MKFVGMTEDERKVVLEALSRVLQDRDEGLARCGPRAGFADVKPAIIAAYKADIALIEKLYDAARADDAPCDQSGCGGKIAAVVCERCRAY